MILSKLKFTKSTHEEIEYLKSPKTPEEIWKRIPKITLRRGTHCSAAEANSHLSKRYCDYEVRGSDSSYKFDTS